MIGSNSSLNDVLGNYYFSLKDRDYGNELIGPVQIASALQNLHDVGMEYVIPFPEKSVSFSFHMMSSAAITAGTVTLETTLNAGFTGSWHVLVNRNFSGGTQAEIKIYNAGRGPLTVVRSRISNALVGGTIDVWFVGSYNRY